MQCYNTQYYDTQHSYTQIKETLNTDTQHNDAQNNEHADILSIQLMIVTYDVTYDRHNNFIEQGSLTVTLFRVLLLLC